MDGTASLSNRDFGRILSLNRRKLLSPVPCAIQNKPHTRAISPIREVNPQRRDSVAERGGFEPSVPLELALAEFGPRLAHCSARITASVLERICSPGVRLCLGFLQFPSSQADARNPVTSNTTRRFGVRISPPRRAVSKGEPQLNARLM
jgi:hypothetical protein